MNKVHFYACQNPCQEIVLRITVTPLVVGTNCIPVNYTPVNKKLSDTVLNKMFEDALKECELELVILLGDIKFVHSASYNDRLFE